MSSSRKWGRSDSFKPVDPTLVSIGSKSIGKINIDCQLLFRESQWGTLEGRPGGIVYLNLNFGPPQGCRVRHATITVALDENDPCLQPYKMKRPRRVLHHSDAAVQLTEWYGPKNLTGEMRSVDITSRTKIEPEANILGYGIGGLGYERSKKFTKEACWTFNGHLLPGEDTPYTSLRWKLDENELEGQSFRNPDFLTAFAFEHSGQPFLIKVEIKGTLDRWRDQTRSKFRFGEGKLVTLIDFEDYHRFPRGLDGIAKQLQSVMEEKNYRRRSTHDLDSKQEAMHQRTSVDTSKKTKPVGRQRSLESKHPVVKNAQQYRQIIEALEQLKAQAILNEDGVDVLSSASSTLVGEELSTEDFSDPVQVSDGIDTKARFSEHIQTHRHTRLPGDVSYMDENMMVRIKGIPGLWVFLLFLVRVMGVFGYKQWPKEALKTMPSLKGNEVISTQRESQQLHM